MNFNLPSEAELRLIVVVLAVTIVAGTLLLGVRYLFGKTATTIALVVGLGFPGLLFFVRSQAFGRVQVADPAVVSHLRTDVSVSTPLTAATPSPARPPSSAIQQIVGNNAPINITELPSWVKNSPHEGTLGAGYCKYVLTSQLYATPEEAEAELNRQLAVDVQQSFTVGESPALGWSPTTDDLRMIGLVKEKVIETVPMKVGEFDTSVQRVSWLVEFNPASQLALLARWQPFEAQKRSKWILSALAAVSATFGVSAFALRRKQAQPTPMTRQMV